MCRNPCLGGGWLCWIWSKEGTHDGHSSVVLLMTEDINLTGVFLLLSCVACTLIEEVEFFEKKKLLIIKRRLLHGRCTK